EPAQGRGGGCHGRLPALLLRIARGPACRHPNALRLGPRASATGCRGSAGPLEGEARMKSRPIMDRMLKEICISGTKGARLHWFVAAFPAHPIRPDRPHGISVLQADRGVRG